MARSPVNNKIKYIIMALLAIGAIAAAWIVIFMLDPDNGSFPYPEMISFLSKARHRVLKAPV